MTSSPAGLQAQISSSQARQAMAALQDAVVRKLEEVVQEEEVGDKLAKMVLGEQKESSTFKDEVKETETALGSLWLTLGSDRSQYLEVEGEHSSSPRPHSQGGYWRRQGERSGSERYLHRRQGERSGPERYLHSRQGERYRSQAAR